MVQLMRVGVPARPTITCVKYFLTASSFELSSQRMMASPMVMSRVKEFSLAFLLTALMQRMASGMQAKAKSAKKERQEE